MARTRADDLVESLLKRLRAYLKPIGFTKSGSTFRRETDEALQFVNVQRNRSSTTEKAIVTVNIGFELKAVRKWFRSNRKVNSVWDCLWNERIGRYLQGGSDKWWTLEDECSVEVPAHEILEALPSMLNHLSNISTEAGALSALKSGFLGDPMSRELKEYLERDPAAEYWPGWDFPLPKN